MVIALCIPVPAQQKQLKTTWCTFPKAIFGGQDYQWSQTRKKHGDARVKLKNVTIQNCTNVIALDVHRLSIDLQDITFIYNCLDEYVTGMIVVNSNISLYGSNYFTNNTGRRMLLLITSTISFHGHTKIIGNEVEMGSTVYVIKSTIIFQQKAELAENEGKAGGAIALYENSQFVFWEQSKITFLRNNAEQNGGAILADASTIVVQRDANITFMENAGYDGGALALQNGGTVTLGSHSITAFTRNHAHQLDYGGALYVTNIPEKETYLKQFIPCFFHAQLVSHNRLQFLLPSLLFHNNTADIAGSSIYGGWVDICKGTGPIFDTIFHFGDDSLQLSAVSSNPTRVCLCTNNLPDCSIMSQPTLVRHFKYRAVAVGQRFGTIPFTVHTRFTSNSPIDQPQIKSL